MYYVFHMCALLYILYNIKLRWWHWYSNEFNRIMSRRVLYIRIYKKTLDIWRFLCVTLQKNQNRTVFEFLSKFLVRNRYRYTYSSILEKYVEYFVGLCGLGKCPTFLTEHLLHTLQIRIFYNNERLFCNRKIFWKQNFEIQSFYCILSYRRMLLI